MGQEVVTDAKRQHNEGKNAINNNIQAETKTNYQDNYMNNQQSYPNYREHDNTRFNLQSNYRNTSSRDNNSSYYRDRPNHYQQANQQSGSYRDNYYHQQHYQQQKYQQPFYRNETSDRYEESERTGNSSDFRQRKAEQNYYRRGMCRVMQRGGNRGYSRSQDFYQGKNMQPHGNQHQGERADYYSSEANQNYRAGSSMNRVLSAKEKELIADFEKSMVMSGIYETPTYTSQVNFLILLLRAEHRKPD